MRELSTIEKITHSTLLSIELAQQECFGAIKTIEKSGYARFETKRKLTSLKSNYKAIERYISGLTGGTIGLLADVADNMDEEVKRDLTVLYYTVKTELDRNGCKESHLFAELVKTSIMIQIANGFSGALRKRVIEEEGKRTNRFGCPIVPFPGFDFIAKLESDMSEITDRIGIAIGQGQINLTNNKKISLAVRAIQNKLVSAEVLTRVLNKA